MDNVRLAVAIARSVEEKPSARNVRRAKNGKAVLVRGANRGRNVRAVTARKRVRGDAKKRALGAMTTRHVMRNRRVATIAHDATTVPSSARVVAATLAAATGIVRNVLPSAEKRMTRRRAIAGPRTATNR